MTTAREFRVSTFPRAYDLPATTAPAPAQAPGSSAFPVARPGRESAEFARAMEDYKRRYNRPFPTWREVLEVLGDLGYEKHADLA